MAGNPHNWKRIINDYFIFSKGQRRAVILLSIAIILAIFLPAVYQFFFVPVTEKAEPGLIEQVAALKVDTGSTTAYHNQYTNGDDNPATAASYKNANDHDSTFSLFAFDPNTATATDWQRLGIRDKTIQTIQKYIAKGGHFYKPEDLKKIYGLRENEVARLLPYVQINHAGKQDYSKDKPNEATAHQAGESLTAKAKTIDINLSDTAAFVSLPGIGSRLAARIVNFRDKLGGFYKVEQVGETYGVPDSTFQKIKPFLFVTQAGLHKKKINTATVEELKSPYIPYNVANAIVQYRMHNGIFKSVEEIRKIPLIDEALYVKIAPYLSVD